MKIACDLDEVLAQFTRGFINYCNNKYSSSVNLKSLDSYEIKNIIGIVGGERNDYFYFLGSSYFNNLEPVNDSIKGIEELINQGFNIEVVTGRPPRTIFKNKTFNIDKKTREWVKTFFPDIKEIHYAIPHGDNPHMYKSSICKRIKAGLIIDDDILNIKDCQNEGLKTIFFNNKYKDSIPKGFNQVRSWKEIVKIISDIYES